MVNKIWKFEENQWSCKLPQYNEELAENLLFDWNPFTDESLDGKIEQEERRNLYLRREWIIKELRVCSDYKERKKLFNELSEIDDILWNNKIKH